MRMRFEVVIEVDVDLDELGVGYDDVVEEIIEMIERPRP